MRKFLTELEMPLIHLQSFSQQTGCNIFGKAEFMNPGGSVKDRAAAQIIKDAIKNKINLVEQLLKVQLVILESE